MAQNITQSNQKEQITIVIELTISYFCIQGMVLSYPNQLIKKSQKYIVKGYLDQNLFLIRILFCLFAEDTDIFPRNKFSNDLKTLTKEDGSDTNVIIKTIFEKLSTNIFDKDKIASYLVDYPYVNGNLFTKDHVEVNFDFKLRKLIIEAGEMLNWAEVNPDILGSMLQAVASSDKRSHLGMHYTSVPNILKTIKPLFLNELNDTISEIVDSELKNNNKAKKLIER